MELPLNNRIRAEYIVPREMIERSHIPDGLVEHLNKQLMSRIADEILMAKPDIVTHSTVKFDDKNPHAQDYHRLRGEVFVFTDFELRDLINKIQVETSMKIREQITFVDNWKNKEKEEQRIKDAIMYALDEDGHTGEWKIKFANDYIKSLNNNL